MKVPVLNKLSRRLRSPLHRRQAWQRIDEYHRTQRSLAETIEWGMNFGCKGLYKIYARQIRSEITQLAEAVAALKPRNILEIGTDRGGTVVIWAALASQKVVSCDLQVLESIKPLLEAMPSKDSSCKVKLLSGDSHSAEFRHRVEQEFQGEPVDFLFIDGDHTAVGVRQDFEDYRHLVRPGGLIAFHDIVERQPAPTNQVREFWQAIRHKLDTKEFVADPDQCGYGIGIVRVPGP